MPLFGAFEEEKKMPEPKKSSLLSDYFETCSCSGVIDFHRAPSKVLKCFWAIIITVALGLTVWQTYQAFEDYFKEDSRFSSVVHWTPMEPTFPFPNVTVCNFNRANMTKAKMDNVEPSVLEYAYAAFAIAYDLPMSGMMFEKNFSTYKMPAYERAWKDYSRRIWGGREPNVGEIMKRYGHDCNTSILKVVYNGMEMHRGDGCYGFSEVVTTYGRCWTFKPPDAQHAPGPAAGLQLYLDPAVHEYSKGVVLNNFMEKGFLIMVGYVGEESASNPVVVQPGSYAYVALGVASQKYTKPTFPVFKLPCREDTTLYVLKSEYSVLNCRVECLFNLTDAACGCVPGLSLQPGYRPCTPNETMRRIMPILERGSHWNEIPVDVKVKFGQCLEMCQNPCEEQFTIAPSVSTTVFADVHKKSATQYVVSHMERHGFDMSRTDATNIVQAKIYFPVLQYVAVEITEATPIFTLIGNIGGQLGLWMGICFFSVLQAVYYLTLRILHLHPS